MHPFIFVQHNRNYLRVDYADIRYIESTGNYVTPVTEKQTFLLPAKNEPAGAGASS